MKINKYNNREQMVAALQETTVKKLLLAIEQKGEASWLVSGGSTPKSLFEAMSGYKMPWDKVQIALVDERWVDIGHPRSNEAFMRAALEKGETASADFTGMKTDHASPFDAMSEVNERYSLLSYPFDSVLLGMGDDGHTASLFPNAKGLEAALYPENRNLCTALTAVKSDVTGDELDRMSLTAASIQQAHHVVLMITGEEKLRVLEGALDPQSSLPIGRLARRKPFEVYWAP